MAHDVPIGSTQVSVAQLSERSRDIFRQIVDSYLATGEPVGSRNISRLISTPLSPASVRNVMSDLENLGLIYAPHTLAGRLPTEFGLRFFVDALMEIGDLGEADRRAMEAKVAAAGKSMEAVLSEASGMLSGLTRAAGVVLTAKMNVRLKHIEFVRLEPERALVVLVAEDGQVENRILAVRPACRSRRSPRRRIFSMRMCAAARLRRRRPNWKKLWSRGRPSSTRSRRRSSKRVLQAGRAAKATTVN